MKDIGSIFPLYKKDLVPFEKTELKSDRIHFSLCREALYAVARSLNNTNRVVLMPAYTCDTVYMPFKQLGYDSVPYQEMLSRPFGENYYTGNVIQRSIEEWLENN